MIDLIDERAHRALRARVIEREARNERLLERRRNREYYRDVKARKAAPSYFEYASHRP